MSHASQCLFFLNNVTSEKRKKNQLFFFCNFQNAITSRLDSLNDSVMANQLTLDNIKENVTSNSTNNTLITTLCSSSFKAAILHNVFLFVNMLFQPLQNFVITKFVSPCGNATH